MDGIIIIDKEKGFTSRDIVNKVGKVLGTKKVGHTGTLDPLATGVLVVCVGKATKLVELITSYDKEYIATFKFGVLTDALDIEGTTIKDEKVSISKEDIINACNSLVGTYDQEVPIYSAVKVNGMKLYEYARKGLDVELPKHKVTISSLELMDYYKEDGYTYAKIKCNVSKGTYIRSLGYDIAKKLGTYAIMTDLRRTRQGKYSIEDALKIDSLTKDTKLISISESLNDYYHFEVDDNLKSDISNGKLLENRYNNDKILFTYKGDALALYEVYDKDNKYLKPYKMFINKV